MEDLENERLVNPGVAGFDGIAFQACVAAIAVGTITLPWLLIPVQAVPLVTILGLAALVLAVKRPALVLSIFMCFSLFRLHEVYPAVNAFRLPLFFSALTAATLVWHVFLSHSLRPFWSFELGALVIFFGLVTLGSAYADSSILAWTYWASIFSKIVVMTLIIAWIPRFSRDFELVARALVLSGLIVASVAVYNKYLGVNLVDVTRVTVARDLNGNLGDPNELALVLLIPLSFSLAFVAYRSGAINRTLGATAAIAILLAVVFTQSRGGFLGTLAVLGVFGLRLKSRVLLGVLSVVVAFGLYLAMGISERMEGLDGFAFDESSRDRLRAWSGAVEMASAHPLTGVGLANFEQSLSEYQPGLSMVAHSTWLGVLGETGIPGFIAFIVLVASAIHSALFSHRTFHMAHQYDELMRSFSTALVAAFAGFCVAASFLTHGFTLPLYILVGLAAAISHYVRESHILTSPRP